MSNVRCKTMLAYVPGHHIDHASWPLGPYGVADPEVSVYDTVFPPLEPYNAHSQPVEPMAAVFTTKAPDYTSSNYPGMSAEAYATVIGTSYPKRSDYEAILTTPTYRLANGKLFGISRGHTGPWIQPGIAAAYQNDNPSTVQVYQSIGKANPSACAQMYPIN